MSLASPKTLSNILSEGPFTVGLNVTNDEFYHNFWKLFVPQAR